MWFITEYGVAINLDNIKTIEFEVAGDGELWEITAYLMDGDERLVCCEGSKEDALSAIHKLIGEDNITIDVSDADLF